MTYQLVCNKLYTLPRSESTCLADPWAGAQAVLTCMAPANSMGVLLRRHRGSISMHGPSWRLWDGAAEKHNAYAESAAGQSPV